MCDAARTGLLQSWASGWYKVYRHQCIVEARLSHIIIALIRPITIILCGQSIHGWSGSLDHPIIITKMIKYVIARKVRKMAAEGSGSAPVPQPSCPVCLRSIAVTNAGLIRQHGPVASRCPGSRRLPTFLASAVPRPPHQRSPVTEGQDERPTLSPDSVLPPRSSGKAIKHLPKASRSARRRSLLRS